MRTLFETTVFERLPEIVPSSPSYYPWLTIKFAVKGNTECGLMGCQVVRERGLSVLQGPPSSVWRHVAIITTSLITRTGQCRLNDIAQTWILRTTLTGFGNLTLLFGPLLVSILSSSRSAWLGSTLEISLTRCWLGIIITLAVINLSGSWSLNFYAGIVRIRKREKIKKPIVCFVHGLWFYRKPPCSEIAIFM